MRVRQEKTWCEMNQFDSNLADSAEPSRRSKARRRKSATGSARKPRESDAPSAESRNSHGVTEHASNASIAAVESLRQELLAQCEQLRNEIRCLSSVVHQSARGASADDDKECIIHRIQERVQDLTDRHSTVLVVSKGDESLLHLGQRTGLHFPLNVERNCYAGYHPAGSLPAIAQLESARARGADYFVIPTMSDWWLDHYAGFRTHLEQRYRCIGSAEDVCRIYDLRSVIKLDRANEVSPATAAIAAFRRQFRRAPMLLNWNADESEIGDLTGATVFKSPTNDRQLPYLDSTIDIVVVRTSDRLMLEEARRVANYAVLDLTEIDGRPSVSIHWIADDQCSTTSVSIIIPTHQGGQRLAACLNAVSETLPSSFVGEILVTADGMGRNKLRELTSFARRDDRIVVLTTPQNLGFVSSCNYAAERATGEILVFLNDDTLPLPGWLSPLVSPLEDDSSVGAVGGQLLYPDGTLQEAGGVIFKDGTGANFGRGDYDPGRPLYQFVRRVDYCSGALLATWRSLFRELGGFDTRYCPAYFEDVDFCFQAKAQGLHTIYQPASQIIHLEGGTCGTNAKSGIKRFQEINRAKFVEKWKERLVDQSEPPDRYDLACWYALSTHCPDQSGLNGL
jgi:GT2 family glycosyltransferase